MPNYAFGTAGRDEQIARHDANQRSRQQNIYDIFNGIGVLAQSVGAAHRMAQQRADEGLAGQFAGQLLANPQGQPTTPLGPGEQGPQQPPTPWSEVWGKRLSAPDNFENVGSLFSPSPQLKLDSVAKLAQIQGVQVAQQRQAALDKRNAILDTARLGLMGAQGEAAKARAFRDYNAPAPGSSETSDMMNEKRIADAEAEARLLAGYATDASTVERGTAPSPGWFAGSEATANATQQNNELAAAKNRLFLAAQKDTRASRTADELRADYAAAQDKVRTFRAIKTQRGRGDYDIHGAATPGAAAPSAPAPAAPTSPAPIATGIEAKYLNSGVPGMQQAIDAFKKVHGLQGPMSAEDEPAFAAWAAAQRGR